MGMFDTFLHPCPKCGHPVEWQTRSGPCALETYTLATPMSPAVAGGLHNQVETCEKCGTRLVIYVQCTIAVSRAPAEEGADEPG